eukprot:TRINITY_DN3144_c0_g1_i1.p1 TRINITY_DN3144_c0_g1~~TRINITY_DN3144_c0_g1_i1.p1  ORF type:complete len:345 (+),score=84.61 TRINITY_DN3144_c0_g1_i1:103-1137(+)
MALALKFHGPSSASVRALLFRDAHTHPQIFAAADAPIAWDVFDVSTHKASSGSLVSDDCLNSIRKNRVALKGPLATPIGKGHVSLNITIRKALNLHVNLRPCRSLDGLPTRYSNVDLVTVRENTEGLYRGIEHEVLPGVVQTIRMTSRAACLRVAEHAFQYAVENGRKKVTAIHQGSIMKQADGLFVQSVREIAQNYPQIEFDDMSINNCARTLVSRPDKLDVMVMENLFGDIMSDLCAGLIGGLGLTPSGNMGVDSAVFEAVHGTAPDIAGQDKANPTALLLSAVMMLRHMRLQSHADLIENAVLTVIREREFVTGDLGGTATTTAFTDAVLRQMEKIRKLQS